MEIYELFYSWVPKYVRYTILFLLAFLVLTANGIYIGNITDMYNALGEYPEAFTMGSNAVYIGMGLGLIFYNKLANRFSNKTLVVTGILFILLMHILIPSTNNPFLIIAACFILGFTKIFALGEVYFAWLKIWSKKFESAKLYPFFYFLALAGLYFMTWLMSYLATVLNWQLAYIPVITILSFSIILVLIFVENHPLKNRIPLYQTDIKGLFLLGAFMMMINYIAVYGKVENWFESKKIIVTSFISLLTLLLFIRRELNEKRPVLSLNLFTKNNFSLGLFYFFVLGIFLPSTFQSSFSGSILHFESIRNAQTNMYMIPGIFIGCLLSYFWYDRKWDGQLLIIIGFISFTAYHIIMYNSFGNNFTLNDFWFPSIVKGFAVSLLYISIGLFTTAKFGIPEVLKVAGTMVLMRSFIASGVFSGIYNHLLYSKRIIHLNYLAGSTDSTDILFKQNASMPNFSTTISNQATLAASKEMTGMIILFGIIFVSILVLSHIYKKMKNTFSLQ